MGLGREDDVGWHGGGAIGGTRRACAQRGGGYGYYSAALWAGPGRAGGPRRREASGQAGGGRWEPPLGGGWAAQPPLFERWLMVQCPAGRGDEGELLGEGVCVGGGQRERERNLKPLMGP